MLSIHPSILRNVLNAIMTEELDTVGCSFNSIFNFDYFLQTFPEDTTHHMICRYCRSNEVFD